MYTTIHTVTSRVPDGSHKDHLEYSIAIIIVTYIWPLIVVCGTLGNILSFCVLMRQAMSDTSVYFYLAMLALADIGVLMLSAFKTWIRVISGFEMLHLHGIWCKMIMYVFLICLHMSAWFVIAVTVDRFIVVWLPLRTHRARPSSVLCGILSNETHQCKVVSFVMLVVLLFYNGHILWTIALRPDGEASYKCSSEDNNYFMSTIFPVMKLLSYCVVPFFIVLLLNAAIIIRISKSKNIPLLNRSVTFKGACTSHQNRITGMLLTVSITWLLLTGPFTIWSLVPNNPVTTSSKAQSFLIKTICFTLMYLNHSINFYLYCLTGARFRRQLREMLCKNPFRHLTDTHPVSRRRSTMKTSMKIIKHNSDDFKLSDIHRQSDTEKQVDTSNL